MMNALKISILILAVSCFASCDCLRNIQGNVIDAETKQPISGVIIRKGPSKTIYTDLDGNFEGLVFINCFARCEEAEVNFEKEGYITMVKKYDCGPSVNDTVVLRKQTE